MTFHAQVEDIAGPFSRHISQRYPEDGTHSGLDEDADHAYLFSILKLSHLWECPGARTYAIRLLGAFFTSGKLRPAQQLSFAIKYNVEEWLNPAILALIALKKSSVSIEDAELIGPQILLKIGRIQDEVQDHAKLIAFSPFAITHDDACHSSLKCGDHWKKAWMDRMAGLLLHPEVTYTAEERYTKVEGAKLGDCRSECIRLTVLRMRNAGAFESFAKVVETGAQCIVNEILG